MKRSIDRQPWMQEASMNRQLGSTSWVLGGSRRRAGVVQRRGGWTQAAVLAEGEKSTAGTLCRLHGHLRSRSSKSKDVLSLFLASFLPLSLPSRIHTVRNRWRTGSRFVRCAVRRGQITRARKKAAKTAPCRKARRG